MAQGGIPVWKNTADAYGRVSILLHWLIAVVVLGQFGLGLWMVELDYYDAWYHRAPEMHKGIGVSLLGIMLLRLVWRFSNRQPLLPGTPLQQALARAMHLALYGVLFAVMLSGYLVSTADGRPVDVFGLMQLPATLTGIEQQEDIAGVFHEWLAMLMIGLTALHVLAALKHHLIDHDRTLLRMLSAKPAVNSQHKS
jgi:cytochrome b561